MFLHPGLVVDDLGDREDQQDLVCPWFVMQPSMGLLQELVVVVVLVLWRPVGEQVRNMNPSVILVEGPQGIAEVRG